MNFFWRAREFASYLEKENGCLTKILWNVLFPVFHQVHKLQVDDLQFFISDNFEIQGRSLVQKMKKTAIWHFMRTFSKEAGLYIIYCELLTLKEQMLFYCESGILRWVGWFQLTLFYEHLKIWTVYFHHLPYSQCWRRWLLYSWTITWTWRGGGWPSGHQDNSEYAKHLQEPHISTRELILFRGGCTKFCKSFVN